MTCTFLAQVAHDIDTYGLSVVTAFGEYCTQRQRILRRVPRLVKQPETLVDMITTLMGGYEGAL